MGTPVESLNIHMLCGSSSKGDWPSHSLNWLRRSEWEMGARRRLRLLSCTRVLRALESRTEVCCGGGGKERKCQGKAHSWAVCSLIHIQGVLGGTQAGVPHSNGTLDAVSLNTPMETMQAAPKTGQMTYSL